MVKLSVVIITLNEEKRLERCLKSVRKIADEIVVVDSYSTDNTENICKQYGVKFIQNSFKGHIEQKNYALLQAKYDHILSLDADEALDEELEKNIQTVKENWKYDGYFFNRLTNYCGHWVRYCGWYPDRKLRLFKKSKAKWSGVNPHDIIEMDCGASTWYLPGDLLHYSYLTISDHVKQTNSFTTIAAKAAFSKGVRSSCFKIVTRPFFKFLRDYFFKLGFLDGIYGFIICFINALSSLLKYAKIKELQQGKEI